MPNWLRNKRGSYANPIIVEGQGNPGSILFKTYLNVENVRWGRPPLLSFVAPAPTAPAPRGRRHAASACRCPTLPLSKLAHYTPLPRSSLSPSCSYLYLLNFSILHPGNADGDHPFHAASCTGLLLRKLVIKGTRTARAPVINAREAAKVSADRVVILWSSTLGASWGACALPLRPPRCPLPLNQQSPLPPLLARTQFNQVQGLYVESCDISVATDNAIDAVAVQASAGCERQLGWAANPAACNRAQHKAAATDKAGELSVCCAAFAHEPPLLASGPCPSCSTPK